LSEVFAIVPRNAEAGSRVKHACNARRTVDEEASERLSCVARPALHRLVECRGRQAQIGEEA
jgi:hypothetical protein